MVQVIVIDAGSVHSLVKLVVSRGQRGSEMAVAPLLGTRRQRVYVGDRARDLVEHLAGIYL